MLKERDAIIIALQHTVNSLRERLEAIEGLSNADQAIASSDQALTTAPLSSEDLGREANGTSDPTRLVVDEEAAAERALERTLVQRGVLLMPRGRIEITPSLAYSHRESEIPGIVELDAGLAIGLTRFERQTFSAGLTARFGLPLDAQLEISIPYLSVDEMSMFSVVTQPTSVAERSGSGTGDFSIGLAKTLMRENGRRPDLVGRIGFSPGRADANDGDVLLGGGFESVFGSLTLVKRRDPLALYVAVAYADIREKDGINPGDSYSLTLGSGLAVSPDSSLFGSISYQSSSEARVANQLVNGTDATAAVLNMGLSTILRRGALLSVLAEIGLNDAAPDYSIGFSMPIQWQLRR